jgi:hypothetical protein
MMGKDRVPEGLIDDGVEEGKVVDVGERRFVAAQLGVHLRHQLDQWVVAATRE